MFNWLIKKLTRATTVDEILDNAGSTISQMGDNKIIVNGKSYRGNNVIVSNNRVYIDGVLQND